MPRVDHDAFCVEFYFFFLIRTIFCVKLSINNHIVGLVHKNHIIRTRLMYHAACKVEFQPFKRMYSQIKKNIEHARTIFCVKLSINNHIVGLVHKNHIIRTRLMYHAACKVEFQPFKRLYSQLTFFNFSSKNFL